MYVTQGGVAAIWILMWKSYSLEIVINSWISHFNDSALQSSNFNHSKMLFQGNRRIVFKRIRHLSQPTRGPWKIHAENSVFVL